MPHSNSDTSPHTHSSTQPHTHTHTYTHRERERERISSHAGRGIIRRLALASLGAQDGDFKKVLEWKIFVGTSVLKAEKIKIQVTISILNMGNWYVGIVWFTDFCCQNFKWLLCRLDCTEANVCMFITWVWGLYIYIYIVGPSFVKQFAEHESYQPLHTTIF